jgi:TPR repeat protein
MYQYGRGVAQNYALAAYWYRRGAEQGNPMAQHLLGLLFDKGLGVPTNHVAAHVWLSLAASRTKGAEHEDNVRLRDAVASKMSFGQLYDAQYLAQSWAPKPELPALLHRKGNARRELARLAHRTIALDFNDGSTNVPE